MDQENLTPSDFCVMGINIKMDKHDSKYIQDTLKEKLESQYAVKIEYINPVYDIGDYFKIAAKYNEIYKKKVLVDEYIKSKNITRDNYITFAQGGGSDDPLFPKEGLICKSPINIEETEKELAEVEAKI